MGVTMVSVKRGCQVKASQRKPRAMEITNAAHALTQLRQAWSVAPNGLFDLAKERYSHLYARVATTCPFANGLEPPAPRGAHRTRKSKPSPRDEKHRRTLFLKKAFVHALPPTAFAFVKKEFRLAGRIFNAQLPA